MADAKMKARVVRIQLEEGKTGLFFATSPDLKGLLVAEPTLDKLVTAIPAAIVEMYEACGVTVVVTKLDNEVDNLRSWVAVRADVAKQALTTA
jgi:hypothetical protein